MDPSKKKIDETSFLHLGICIIGLISIFFFFFFYSVSIDGNILSPAAWPWSTSSYNSQQIMQIRRESSDVYLKDELEQALNTASNENKTVIIVMVNDAYVVGDKPMLDLFLDAFWVGENTGHLVDNLLIVAAGNLSYKRCKFLRLHCYNLQKIGVQSAGDEKLFMSRDFVEMMWRRTRFLLDVLKRGYNFVFTDADVLWLRNPFEELNLYEDETKDLQISTDNFKRKNINTGFYMVRSNNRTIQLFDEWYGKKNYSKGRKEQDVLQILINRGIFTRLGLQVKFLDTLYFSGFCQDSKDIKAVKTVHANCCRSIKAKKVDLLGVIHDWKRYKNHSSNHTKVSEFRWSPHIACQNSWKS